MNAESSGERRLAGRRMYPGVSGWPDVVPSPRGRLCSGADVTVLGLIERCFGEGCPEPGVEWAQLKVRDLMEPGSTMVLRPVPHCDAREPSVMEDEAIWLGREPPE